MDKINWEKINALGTAACGAKDAVAGHRVYLRCMTLLELELGIINPKNYEVKEGFLTHPKILESGDNNVEESEDDLKD